MTPVTYSDAQIKHPQLVGHVLDELAQSRPDLDPDKIEWYEVACGAEPEDLMDEGAIADHLLTGYVPCDKGIAGVYEGVYRCACDRELVKPGTF